MSDRVAQDIINAPGEVPVKRERLDSIRVRFWDCRSQYRPEKGFMPHVGKVLEVWRGRWGEPRLQLVLETGHRRFWHRPRVYDFSADDALVSKGISGLGFFAALTVRRWRKCPNG